MTRSMLFVGIAVVLGAPGMAARAQEPRPEEIIDKAIRAHGGEEKLAGLSAFTLKERMVYPGAATYDTQIVVQLPGRYRSERTISSGGKSSTTLIVLDGDQGWMKSNDVVTPYPKTFLESMQKYTVPYTGPQSILRLRARQKNPACQFTTAGEGTVEGRPAVGLRMKLEGGPEATWYFDKETGLLLKEEQRTKRFEGEDEVVENVYGDYQTCDGFPIAHKLTHQHDGKVVLTRELIDFKAATPSEGAFAKP
jgi:hypothetical protein